jgi:CheY-like chemotaxis protein
MPSILVVEDEPLSRLALTRFLSDAGYSVKEAASGEEALKLLNTGTFDAVIADFKLKDEITGFEVLSEFERITPGRGKILLTAYPAQEVRAESVGAVYVPKPVELDDLLLKLRKILE